jgi:putative heme transporter
MLTGGIPGALLAVPLLAVLNSAIRSLLRSTDQYTNPIDGLQAGEPEHSGPEQPGLEVPATRAADHPTAAARL